MVHNLTWDTVTIAQYIAVCEHKNPFEVFYPEMKDLKAKAAKPYVEQVKNLMVSIPSLIKEPTEKIDWGTKTYGQRCAVENELRAKHKTEMLMLKVLSWYYMQKAIGEYNEDRYAESEAIVSEWPCKAYIPIARKLIETFTTLLEVEAKELGYKPTALEVQAGVDRLGSFGKLSTVHTLANGDILKHGQILSLQYNHVFATLRFEKEKALYSERLVKLQTPKPRK